MTCLRLFSALLMLFGAVGSAFCQGDVNDPCDQGWKAARARRWSDAIAPLTKCDQKYSMPEAEYLLALSYDQLTVSDKAEAYALKALEGKPPLDAQAIKNASTIYGRWAANEDTRTVSIERKNSYGYSVDTATKDTDLQRAEHQRLEADEKAAQARIASRQFPNEASKQAYNSSLLALAAEKQEASLETPAERIMKQMGREAQSPQLANQLPTDTDLSIPATSDSLKPAKH